MLDEPLTVPDISKGLGPIPLVERAVVVPPMGPAVKGVTPMGVLDAEGRLVPESLHWRGAGPMSGRPPMPLGESLEELPGTWMYMGLFFGHFGHFLMEGLTRLWALDRLRGQVDGVLFNPRQHLPPEAHAGARHGIAVRQPILAVLGAPEPARMIVAPTRVERLFVPAQGLGLQQMSEGAPEYRAFLRAHAGKGIAPQGAERIYISRSARNAKQGGSILAERVLEEHLKAEGYEVFHPQQHSFEEQVAAYRAARQVISTDCSPLHLLAMVGHADQTVCVISRRPGGDAAMFARQIEAFQGARAFALDLLTEHWLRDGHRQPGPNSWGRIDMTALWERLRAVGMIGGDRPWPDPTDAELEEELAAIGRLQGTTLRRWDGAGGAGSAKA